MTIIEKIKAEIERFKATNPSEYNYQNAEGYVWALDDVLSFLDTLEEPVCEELNEAAEQYVQKGYLPEAWLVRPAFIAGAKWQADHTPLPKDTVLFNKGVAAGKRLMMEEAVKWRVDDDYYELTEKGRFILGSVGIGYNGYYIPYSDLLKLPKEGEK